MTSWYRLQKVELALPATDLGVHPILRDLKSEIHLYKMMPPLAFFSDDEKITFSNPLYWGSRYWRTGFRFYHVVLKKF